MSASSSNLLNRYLSWAERVLLFPLVPALSTISGVVAGYTGSHFDKEIEIAYVPWGWGGWHPAWGASLFWLLTVIFAVTFGGTFWAQSRSGDRHSKRMENVSDSIESKTRYLQLQADGIDARVKQLFTLPPLGFLEDYEDAVGESFDNFSDWSNVYSSGPLDAGGTEEVARLLLRALMQVAVAFDADSTRATYSANVMMFLPSDMLTGDLADTLQRKLQLADEAASVSLMFGVLDVVPKLSVSTLNELEPLDVDPLLVDLCLPIPRSAMASPNSAQGPAPLVLPGAPVAFTSKTVSAVERQSQLLQHMESRGFSKHVVAEMRRYLDKNKQIQSFISVPLLPPSSVEDFPSGYSADVPFAVVNINRNMDNSLSAERMALFQPLLEPFRQVLSRLLWAYRVEMLYSSLQTGSQA